MEVENSCIEKSLPSYMRLASVRTRTDMLTPTHMHIYINNVKIQIGVVGMVYHSLKSRTQETEVGESVSDHEGRGGPMRTPEGKV